MCFSAEASFAGGAVISTIGVLTVKHVRSRSHLAFGLIPILFGLQQFAEGSVWLSIPDPDLPWLLKLGTYFFLAMALVIWPTLVPLSVFAMEEDRKRKNILRIFLVAGVILSGYYAYCLASFPVKPEIAGSHIQYDNIFPAFLRLPSFILYLLVTILPLFVSGVRGMYVFGILIFLSCMLTGIFFTQYLTSVWCFFAALISGVVYWILKGLVETSLQTQETS
jgi:hypothetical protein